MNNALDCNLTQRIARFNNIMVIGRLMLQHIRRRPTRRRPKRRFPDVLKTIVWGAAKWKPTYQP